MSKRITQLLFVLIVLLLQACASDGKKWNPNDYTVKSGDTVYSIAWRYELNPFEFARWNNINSDHFLIHPGQRLRVRKPAGFGARQAVSAKKTGAESGVGKSGLQATGRRIATTKKPLLMWIRVKSDDTLYGISKKYGVSVSRLVQLNRLKKPYIIQPGQRLFLKYPGTTLSRKSSKKMPGKQISDRQHTLANSKLTGNWARKIRWKWPVKGKILSRFVRGRHNAKGIDIGGNMGSRVNAAADGKVVYSGNGLISYGNLVIIKHNNHYLSAYAYNHKLLVHEGQWVKSGQQIAEMGRSGKRSPRLHFEIRRDGKPVNPLRYLP